MKMIFSIIRFISIGWLMLACLYEGSLTPFCATIRGAVSEDGAYIWQSKQLMWITFITILAYIILISLYLISNTKGYSKGFVFRNVSLFTVLTICALNFFLNYKKSSESTDALTFVYCILIGRLVLCCITLDPKYTAGLRYTLIIILGAILIASTNWMMHTSRLAMFASYQRWIGPWQNPNTFGILMGAAVVLLCGFIIMHVGNITLNLHSKFYCILAILLLYSIVAWRALLNSFSRGAWVATASGLTYLAINTGHYHVKHLSRLAKVPFYVGVISVSLFLGLLLWLFINAPQIYTQRAITATDSKDFSWQNRLVAWEGALQIMSDHKLLGVGWNCEMQMYEFNYLPPKTIEGGAIFTNDYLTIGITLGLPAFFCFLSYVWHSVFSHNLNRGQHVDLGLQLLQTTYLAGALVFIVGFCFNGGLFKVPTASVFWVLLELGGADFRRFERYQLDPHVSE
jgi:O-antigen ligase